MLRSYQNLRGIVTLFHLPTSQTSKNLLTYIKKTYPDPATRGFDIEVTESKPTSEQAKSILSYYKGNKPVAASPTTTNAPSEATGHPDLDSHGIVRPLLVDWDNGRIAMDDIDASKKLLESLSQKK